MCNILNENVLKTKIQKHNTITAGNTKDEIEGPKDEIEKSIPITPDLKKNLKKLCNSDDLKNKLLENDIAILEEEHRKHTIEKSIPRTSELYHTLNIPDRFEHSYTFKGYGVQEKRKNQFYRTVNSEYGYYFPNPHTVPTRYFPRHQKFSVELSKAGLYRNYSLNTQSDTNKFSTKLPTLNAICRK